jgi:hypothetical protein
MLDLGLGSYLKMVEERWGALWSGLLMLIIYLAILAICLPLIWGQLILPAYRIALAAVSLLSGGLQAIRTPTVGWLEIGRQLIAAVLVIAMMCVAFVAWAFIQAGILIAFVKMRGKPLNYYLPKTEI